MEHHLSASADTCGVFVVLSFQQGGCASMVWARLNSHPARRLVSSLQCEIVCPLLCARSPLTPSLPLSLSQLSSARCGTALYIAFAGYTHGCTGLLSVAPGLLHQPSGQRCAWGWWRQQAPGSIVRDCYGRARGRGERYRRASVGEFSGTSVSPLPRGTPGERGAMSLRVVDSDGEGREPNRD